MCSKKLFYLLVCWNLGENYDHNSKMLFTIQILRVFVFPVNFHLF
jgi:hypothetical protein